MLRHSLVVILFCSYSLTAAAVISPYIGTEYKKEWMSTHNYWSDVLSDSYSGGNLFIGARFIDVLAIELGYDWTGEASKDHYFGATGTFFGLSANNVSSNAKVKFTGWHTDFNVLIPLLPMWKLIGSAGLAVVKPKLNITSPDTAGTSVDSVLNSVNVRSEPITRLGLGASFQLHTFTIRGMWRWQDTASLRLGGNATFNSLSDAKKAFKSGHSLSLGVIFDF